MKDVPRRGEKMNKKITIRIKEELYEQIKLLSKQENMSFQKTIVELIELGMIKKLLGGLDE